MKDFWRSQSFSYSVNEVGLIIDVILGGGRGPDPTFLEWDEGPPTLYVHQVINFAWSPHFSDQSYATGPNISETVQDIVVTTDQ